MGNSPIICALDMLSLDRAVELTREIRNLVAMVKVGLEFFVVYGMAGVRRITSLDVPVFLDLKLHDIPNTVEMAIRAVKGLNVRMLTVHVSGGRKMLERAVLAASDSNIVLVGVTVLTSMDASDLTAVGVHKPVEVQVADLADFAVMAGLKAVVCSAHEIETVRGRHLNMKLVVPGIRTGLSADDQKRVSTPQKAISAGADYLIIGRPITQSKNPISVIEDILCTIGGQ